MGLRAMFSLNFEVGTVVMWHVIERSNVMHDHRQASHPPRSRRGTCPRNHHLNNMPRIYALTDNDNDVPIV